MNELNVSIATLDIDLGGEWLVIHRRIARELAIHRETVGAAFATGRFKNRPKCSPAQNLNQRQNQPFRSNRNWSWSQTGHSAHRVFDCRSAKFVCHGRRSLSRRCRPGCRRNGFIGNLICNHAFTGGYHSVQRFVRSCSRHNQCRLCGWKWNRDRKPRWILGRVRGCW